MANVTSATLDNRHDIQVHMTYSDCNHAQHDVIVDWVGGSWLFPSWFARVLWAPGAWVYTWDNAEDITFGIVTRRLLGAPSVLARQHNGEHFHLPHQDGTCVFNNGSDPHATSWKSDHWPIRRAVLKYWYSRGWRGVCPGGPFLNIDPLAGRCVSQDKGPWRFLPT